MTHILPIVVILASVVVTAVPWGLPGETTFILPFVTFLLVFMFSARRKSPFPAWLAFLAGLGTDVLTAGPLGYWAMLYTLGHALARFLALSTRSHSLIGLWFGFAAAAAAGGAAGWAVAALYYLRLIDWWPIALGTGIAVAICPFVALTMRRSLGLGHHRPLEAGGLTG